jgi:hypothetical protein
LQFQTYFAGAFVGGVVAGMGGPCVVGVGGSGLEARSAGFAAVAAAFDPVVADGSLFRAFFFVVFDFMAVSVVCCACNIAGAAVPRSNARPKPAAEKYFV